jgi:hypothetical protein
MRKLTPYGKNLLGFIAIVLVIAYVFIRNHYHENLLDNGKTKETIAFIINIDDGSAVHSTSNGDFEFKIKNKKYTFNDSGDYTFLKIGDSVLIEYSLKDPSVARVIDKCYMQKYKGKYAK